MPVVRRLMEMRDWKVGVLGAIAGEWAGIVPGVRVGVEGGEGIERGGAVACR